MSEKHQQIQNNRFQKEAGIDIKANMFNKDLKVDQLGSLVTLFEWVVELLMLLIMFDLQLKKKQKQKFD